VEISTILKVFEFFNNYNNKEFKMYKKSIWLFILIPISLILLILLIRKSENFTVSKPKKNNSSNTSKRKSRKNISPYVLENGKKYDIKTVNNCVKLSQLSLTQEPFMSTKAPIFNSRKLNHRMILLQKVFDMVQGRGEQISKISNPKELQNARQKFSEMLVKIPIYKTHDFVDILTKDVKRDSKNYDKLLNVGMQLNDFYNKTDLCSKDKGCIAFQNKMDEISKKRENVLKDMKDISLDFYNIGQSGDEIKESFEKPPCKWWGPVSYGTWCGPAPSEWNSSGGLSVAINAGWESCDILDECCHVHDLAFRACQNSGDWCLQNLGSGVTGPGLCTSSICTVKADLAHCLCTNATVLKMTLADAGLGDDSNKSAHWSAYPFAVLMGNLFCNPLKYLLALVIGIVYVLVVFIIWIVECLIKLAEWIWDLLVDLSEWFGDKWDDFWDWWNEEDANIPDDIPHALAENASSLVVATVSDEGTPEEQVTNMIELLSSIFNTKYTPGIFGEIYAKPVQGNSKCPGMDCYDLSQKPDESAFDRLRRIKCCLNIPTYRSQVDFSIPPPQKPSVKFPNIPEQVDLPPYRQPESADSTDDLPPPPGSGNDDNIACVTRCYNGYTGVVCTNRDTGQTVSETWSSDQNIARCCTTQCINDTWHTVCTPHPGVDSGISCDNRPPKL